MPTPNSKPPKVRAASGAGHDRTRGHKEGEIAGAAARAVAANAVGAVLKQGESLSSALPRGLAALKTDSERALAQELAYGSLRFACRLGWYLQQLLQRPLKRRDSDVYGLLLVGLYQLICLQTPPHVAVDTTVGACRSLNKPWAGALVNAVLRNLLRRQVELQAAAVNAEPAALNHPPWLLTALRSAWPADWPAILAANDTRPPMSLRVNCRRSRRNEYLQRLGETGLEAAATRHSPEGVTLASPIGVAALPGFNAGDVSVQDEAAQLAAHLLDPQPAQRLLDACAAPGGKTAHLLELEPRLALLTAVEKDPQRLQILQSTLARLNLQAQTHCADATRPGSWWDGTPFDRILLDAPCTATGVIRRHPDIKMLRKREDLAATGLAQRELLEALWPLLRPGGKLLYVTCSVLPGENQDQIRAFVERHPDAQHLSIESVWGRPLDFGRQILPGEDSMDGFYYALLQKA